jgi:hypothetical protein
VRETPGYNRDVYDVLKAEQHLRTALARTRLLPDDYQGFSAAELMIEALGLPKPALKQAWDAAVKQLLHEAKPQATQDIYLCAHTVFYHQLTREFFVPVNVDIIRAWKPELIVTLLDDTEHCLDRLRASGQMFGSYAYSYAGLDGFANALKNMRVLFDWRATEILEAERLAAELGVSHFCLAMKHPLETAASLVYRRNRPVVYLSHPISEPRRKLLAGDADAVTRFVADLSAPCVRLRRATTLIEPTTIDEFRLRNFTTRANGGGGSNARIFLPRHTTRWPVPPDTLWVRPPTMAEQPLDPGGYFTDEILEEFEHAKKRLTANGPGTGQPAPDVPSRLIPVEIAVNLMGVLIGHITTQIDARDHKLVEQSQGLIVLRPVYEGNPSRGVLQEIKYHCQLCATGLPRPLGLWIYTHLDDEFAWLCRTWLVQHLQEGLKLRTVLGTGHSDSDERIIQEVAASVTPSGDRESLAHRIMQELSQRGIRYIGQYEDKPLDPRIESASVEARRQFVAAFVAARPPYITLVEDYVEIVPELHSRIVTGPENSLDSFVGEIIESCNHLAAEPRKG